MPSQRLLVVQPYPGIGDMIWHLPHIRALARHAGAPVTILTKPRSQADTLLAAEDSVSAVIWVDRNPKGGRGAHDGPAGLWRLVQVLRAGRFDAACLLHHSASLAFAAWAAGIPRRQGYGLGPQRWFLNQGPFLSRALWRRERPRQRAVFFATQFLRAAGIPLDDTEPHLSIAPGARAAVRQRLAALPRPMVALGIGSSEPMRQWGAVRFAALVRALLGAGWPGIVLLGGPAEAAMAQEIAAASGDAAGRVVPALGWHLGETAALLADAAFYAGNDTGAMNMAAAVGTRAYAFFGTTPPFFHSPLIVPVVSPPGGPHDGTARITVEAVLALIAQDRGALSPSAVPAEPTAPS